MFHNVSDEWKDININVQYTAEYGVLLPQVSACLAFGEGALGTYAPRLLTKCFSTLANLAIDRGACATYFAPGPPIKLA